MNPANQKKLNSRFIEPEKLADLRTKREIELMNGRPWTRELPPPPVLPPYGPLEKISGRLESFSSECFREYFDTDAYRTSSLPEVSDAQRGAGAALAITAGSPAVGAVMMMEGDQTDTAEYIQGMINGKPFCGWVGQTRLQSGDEVEMAVEWQHDHFEVYAIALPEERIISVCPKCDMGHIAHAWWRIKNMLILIMILMIMFVGICIYINLSEPNFEAESFLQRFNIFLLMCLGVSTAISGLIAFSAYKAYAPTCCKLTEEICQLLGMKNVSQINLNKITKEREQQLIDKGMWHDPGDQNKPACPSGKFIYSGESWFYY
jgi:hypothetical protein